MFFNFAFIAVAQTGHCCCDNGAVTVLFKDCLGNMLATTSNYSVTAPAGSGCTPSGNCSSPSTITSYPGASLGWAYNKWEFTSIDLSLWMGQCIVVQVTAVDCPYSGHGGYAYFDAQCAPGKIYPTGINSISNHSKYKLYPNPNSGNFNIEIGKDIGIGEIELHNILGQTVHKQFVKKGNNFIKTENLAKGLYNYSVISNKEVVSVGKIVIE